MTQKLVTWSTVHETKFIGLTLLKEFARPYALLPYIEKKTYLNVWKMDVTIRCKMLFGLHF